MDLGTVQHLDLADCADGAADRVHGREVDVTSHSIATREVRVAADTVPEQLVMDGFDVADQDCGAGEAEVAGWALMGWRGNRCGCCGGGVVVVGGRDRCGGEGGLAQGRHAALGGV